MLSVEWGQQERERGKYTEKLGENAQRPKINSLPSDHRRRRRKWRNRIEFTWFFLQLCILWPHLIKSTSLSACSCVPLCEALCPVAWQAPLSVGLSSKNAGVGCHALLQGIFLTQGSNPHLLSLALACRFFTTTTTWEASYFTLHND